MAKAKAEIEITASDSKLAAGLSAAGRKVGEWGVTLARGTSSAMNGVFSKIKMPKGIGDIGKHAIGNLASSAVSKGISGFVDIAEGVLAFEKTLTQLRVTGEMSAAQVDAFRTSIKSASKETGAGADELAKGALALVNFTGHAENAQAALPLMGKAIKATGASAEDVAGVFATFDKNLKLPVDQWEGMLDVWVKQGHLGGVEFTALAGSMTKVSAAAAGIFKGGATVGGQGQISAIAQVLNDSTHDATVTSDRMIEMFNDMVKPATVKRMRGAGIEPFDKQTGKVRPMLDLLDELKKKNLSVEKTSDIFRDVRGSGAIRYLVDNLDAVHNLDGGLQSSGQTAKDWAVQHESASGKIEDAMNSMKLAAASAFTPERLEAFANALAKIAGGVDVVIGKLEDVIKRFEEVRMDTNEDQTAKMVAQGKGQRATYKDMLADDLEKDSDARSPILAAQGILGSPLGKLAMFGVGGGRMEEALSLQNGNSQLDAAIQLRGQANRQHLEARTEHLDAAFGRPGDKAPNPFAAPPTFAGQMGFDYGKMGAAVAAAIAANPAPAPQMNVDATRIDRAVAAGSKHPLRGKS